MDEPKQLTHSTDTAPEAFTIHPSNEVKPMTAREKGLADGYKQAIRECAIDLKRALQTKGDPEFRQFCTETVLEWFEEAVSGD